MANVETKAEELPDYYAKSEYFDCLEHGSSDLSWSLKTYSAPSYAFSRLKEPHQIIEDILSSENVEHAIREHAKKENAKEDKIRKEAKLISEEIAHRFNLKTIRFMAYTLSKIVRRLFRHIYVNKEGVAELSDAVRYAPLVLVPTHNSYFDFLLVSFISFAVNLPLPGIAAGHDFLHIAIVNRLLRGSGAFFMRRSFANDKLYKAIFTQYVQELIKAGQMPVEFFLEGTRSRSGKALQPKLGLLSMITEMFFLGYVHDVQFCPVSISYECITEEHLYLFELLGLPKPKESLKGLVKARKVFESDYGNVHIHFGKVMSFKEYCEGRINRLSYASVPRFEAHHRKLAYGSSEKKVLMDFARCCVYSQQSNLTIYPRAVVAVAANQSQLGMSIGRLCCLLPKVRQLLRSLHRRIHGFEGDSQEKIVLNAVSLLSPTVQINDQKVVVVPYELSSKDLQRTELGKILEPNGQLTRALSRVLLLLQKNKLMNALLLPALIVVAGNLMHHDVINFDKFQEKCLFLYNVFKIEFVYYPHLDLESELERCLDVLEAQHCISVSSFEKSRKIERSANDDVLLFLEGLMLPFIEAYWIVGQYLASFDGELPCKLTSLSSQIQLFAATEVQEGYLKTYESIILMTLKNALLSFCEAGCLTKSRNSNLDIVITSINNQRVQDVVIKLGELGHLPQIWLKYDDTRITVKSKL